MMLGTVGALLGLSVIVAYAGYANAELTPPYFNLAEGRKISASATCGVDTDGPELYCKLVGANTENDHQFSSLIQGQVCDYCDPKKPSQNHPPEYAIDGKSNWWQSPPLSRGMKYNEVNLTIDFGQEFHVAYLFIRMGNSPRPGLWTLEKSSDYGKTWKAWQHFSDTPADCETYFGKESLNPITSDDDVICTTEYSKIVPLEDGEIPVRLLNNRPSANNYFNSTVLQEWTRATNVRFRFLRTKNLLGHLMSVARQDPTVTRRYFYSIKDISIGGRCMCNGHADTCHVLEPSPTRVLACQCRHNTCGIQCAECCPGFEQKKWRQNTNAWPFICEPCNCHGHSNTCEYDESVDDNSLSLDMHGIYEGGGVCKNCQHNTEGINCNKCRPTFYRPYGRHWNESQVCKPCDCENFYSTGNCEEETGRCECKPEYQAPDCQSCSYGHFGFPNCRACECNMNGTNGYHCESTNGKCPCKQNFGGDYCKTCAVGYYGLPECNACECNAVGSVNDVCDFNSGQCLCNSNFDGKQCDRCKNGYFNYPSCLYCDCDQKGSEKEVCDKDAGHCICKAGYGGPRCDQCLPGFFNYPDCVPCNCSTLGSVSTICDVTGKCPCLPNFAGKQCTLCSTGYFAYPECLPCNCESHGSVGISCNNDGQCLCSSNFDGKNCNLCKEGYYNFPACEECNCDPAGVIAKFAGCGSVPAGQLCQCKERVIGRICDQCKPLYWNLNVSNSEGCEDCECFMDGTIGALDTCESKSGQCSCKPYVTGRSCAECKDGSFDLFGGNLFGCKDCDCDIGGSIHSVCNKDSGQCLCQPRVDGRTCSYPLTTHYFPTLYQNQFEFEDGYTPSGTNVRYQFDEEQFPSFSKRGYAKFSIIQSEVISEVNIFKSSVYRMVIRFVNPTEENIVAQILITSDNPNEVDQTANVLFRSTADPQFVTVSGSKGTIPSPIVLDPGRYTISVKTDKYLFLDYFVLLPAAFYESSILTKKIENPCELGNLHLCRHYKYPAITEFKPTYTPFIAKDNEASKPAEFYSDNEHLSLVQEDRLPMITGTQPILNYIVDVTRTGPYIVVVDYVTDRNTTEPYIIRVNLAGSDGDADGVVTLYPCTYTTVCRQPVIDKDSREKVFYMDTSDLKPFEIKGEDSVRAAIKSIAIVPVEDWSIDLITPSPVCVMQDGKCVQTMFRTAPDSKKIEFEYDHEDRITATNPIDIFDNSTKLVYLDINDSTMEIRSKVPHEGFYHILVKYYQPNHQQFSVNYKIDTDKAVYNGKLPLRNCPSNSGCRELIRPADNSMWFEIVEGITITFTNNLQKGVWFDYVLLVPASEFSESLLNEETFDQTKEFIKQCGQDHFHIQLNASEFCKQAVFSLTSDYNDGALPCNCDYSGSTSFECDPFGGQCQCKSNIIGRQCEACRTGFFGFPDCKPCDCPSTALCEKETGDCICPPRVTGEKCDKCEPLTFGFDQIIGCELCNCDQLGVERSELQCDMNNGTCNCRPHIEGRTCDKCVNGFFNFPHCEPCRCSKEGTTFEICNQEDESCYCKKNVLPGGACDRCVDGTYNLQDSNPDGCTKCFCFGKTSRCDRAFLRPFNVSMLKDVSIATMNFTINGTMIARWPVQAEDITVNETTLQADMSLPGAVDGLVYFGVLDYLLDQNNHLTAYGGHLTYTLFYTTGLFGKALHGPDVLLLSKEIVLVHQSYEQPANAINFYASIKMVESNFRTDAGAPVTREQLMMVLRNLDRIFIRGAYWEQTVISQLSDVYLTMADEDEENYNQYEELAVEKCQCPPGYRGNSCEDCAPGYYRDPIGLYGGRCIPCNCNGHADTCDCNTGVCHECKHSTTGEHCDQCIVGYHGDATIGTPNDCMICACPMPNESNNFATSCEISENGYEIYCTCRKGYYGERCQSCASGFFGKPEEKGEFCKPCQCSGNIDTNEGSSCDSVTGECLQCLNNTFGTACNLCAPGFYGDAIKLKDCQSCICDELGTDICDNYIGTCHCQDNVIGEKCDRCEADHYGFDSGLGCRSCDCGVASNSTQCDDHTGDCRCKPGVTGRQCDRCQPGYYDYTEEGCRPCSCNTDYSRGLGCNAQTGQCECLPGVVGEKCDACPYRWVLEPDIGCHECDICHHALLDVTDSLRSDLEPVVLEFETIAGGYFTAQKLVYLNETIDKMEPDIRALDPNGVNLTPLSQQVESLEHDIKSVDRNVLYTEQRAKDASLGGFKLVNDTEDARDIARLTQNTVKNTIREVEKLADSFDASAESTKVDKAIEEADGLLNNLRSHAIHNSTKQLDDVNAYLATIQRFSNPVTMQNAKLEILRNAIGNFSDKMEDLIVWSLATNAKSQEAKTLFNKYKDATVNSKFETVQNQSQEANKNIENSYVYVKKGKVTLGEIFKNIGSLDNVNNELKEVSLQVDSLLPNNHNEITNLSGSVDEVTQHTNKLVGAAQSLTLQLSNITSNAENALKAANAYKDIVDAVNNARNAIKNAKESSGNATELCDGIGDRAGSSDHVASKLLDEARESLNTVQADLQPHLNRSSETVQQIIDLNQRSDDQTTTINKALDQINIASPTELWQNSRDKAIDAQKKAQDALDILKPITKELTEELKAAKQMPKEVDDTNKDIAQVSKQVERVATMFPELKELADQLNNRQDAIAIKVSRIGDSIDALKKQIENAREAANSVKVGVTFQPSTTLELKPPSNLPDLSQNSRVSTYIKTDKPNGFILYLGNENKTGTRRNKRDSFMALEIENGYPILTVDLGNGPQKIISNKHVANGQWHQVIVERTGNNVKLIVREEIADGKDQLHEVEEMLPGNSTNFDVDRENTKLFVGGYPPDYNIQEGLKYSSFEGQIEDLRIGEQEVGLWNFVDAQDNNNGALERDRLITSEVPATGYRFSGQGYVILDSKPYVFKQRSSIQFKFKVSRDVSDGLIFYAGKNRHFIAVEMRNGGIYFQYKLGQHLVTIGTDEQFNDDQWHKVDADRVGRKGVLKVDNKDIYQENTVFESTEEILRISEKMYFGGYPEKLNHTEITNKNFDGCIDDIYIDGTPVDLSRNLGMSNVRAGCPPKFSKMLTYGPRQFGYLRRGNVSSKNHFQVNLKFKTKQKDGLIFYGTSHDQEATIGLALRDGALVLSSQKLELTTGQHTFNDGEWHVVTATHDAKKLRMNIHEVDEFVSNFDTTLLIIEHGDIYFGGLPKGFKTPQGALASTAYFVGCISDVTIGGQLVNFANSTDRKNAVLDNCHRDALEYDSSTLQVFYPEDNVDDRMNEIEIKQEEKHQKNELEGKRDEEEREKEQVLAQERREQQKIKEQQRQKEEEAQRRLEEERKEEERKKEERKKEDERRINEERDKFSRINQLENTSEGEVEGEELPKLTTPPSTPRPTRKRPVADNKTEPICALPVEPDLDVDFDAGYRFGTYSDSRVEFTAIPTKIKKSYDIALSFRTSEPDGILFYASDSRHTDFIALYMQNGKLYHAFNCGSGSANISSKYEYNNNEWHTVLFTRNHSKGRLLINDEDDSFGESFGTTRTMAVQAPFSFGGVSNELMEDSYLNMKMSKGKQFHGCIRNMQMAARGLGEPTLAVGVLPCSNQVENGVFFGKGGGYVKLRNSFKVGTEMTIELQIKPRSMNGLLLSVHGKRAFLILQLINGTLNFAVDNGDGPIVAKFSLEQNEKFCDGKWRKILAVKSQFVITLAVDNMSSEPSIGSTLSLSTDTTRPLFLGGHPHLSRARGLGIRKPYSGCIRNVKIKDIAEEILPGMAVGNVQTGVCPTN